MKNLAYRVKPGDGYLALHTREWNPYRISRRVQDSPTQGQIYEPRLERLF